jgi:hypothetical protein
MNTVAYSVVDSVTRETNRPGWQMAARKDITGTHKLKYRRAFSPQLGSWEKSFLEEGSSEKRRRSCGASGLFDRLATQSDWGFKNWHPKPLFSTWAWVHNDSAGPPKVLRFASMSAEALTRHPPCRCNANCVSRFGRPNSPKDCRFVAEYPPPILAPVRYRTRDCQTDKSKLERKVPRGKQW